MDKVRHWLRHGADVNGRMAPLVTAVVGGHAEIVALLLSAGADPRVAGPGGQTAAAAAVAGSEIAGLLERADRSRPPNSRLPSPERRQ